MDCTDEEEKVFSLIAATSLLETLQYRGEICSASQRLKWPRQGEDCEGRPFDCSTIPYKIKEATVMLAMQMAKDPGGIIGGGGVDNSSCWHLYSSGKSWVILKLNTPSSTTMLVLIAMIAMSRWLTRSSRGWKLFLGCLTDMPVIGGARIIGRVRS